MNPAKIAAVKEIVQSYPMLAMAEIAGFEALSGVSSQPKSLQETIEGAKNRARNAFKDCDLSFGLESGLMAVPHTKTGYMDVTCCAIYDGKDFHIGLSSAFEHPREAVRLVFEEGMDINQAFHKIGLTGNVKIGSAEGAIGILTKGRLTRKDYTKQAILTALIHLENPHLF